MENKRLLAFTAVGLAAAIAVPTIAFGNARSNVGNLHITCRWRRRRYVGPTDRAPTKCRRATGATPTAPAPLQ